MPVKDEMQTYTKRNQPCDWFLAVRTRLELATSGVTGRHSNQTELPHQVNSFPNADAKIDIFWKSANILLKKTKIFSIVRIYLPAHDLRFVCNMENYYLCMFYK